jgi:hypothetical protein
MVVKQLAIGFATAVALVLVAACSSSGSSGPKGSTVPTGSTGSVGSAEPTASPSPTVTPPSTAQLRKIVLQATDLPGWKATPPDDTSDAPDSAQADLVACVGAANTDADQLANVESNKFDLGDVELSASASSYRSPSAVDTDVAILKSPKFLPCIRTQMQEDIATAVPAGSKVGTVSVKFTPGSGTGPANVAGSGQASVPVTVNGQQFTDYVDFVYLTGPLLEVEVDAESPGAPVPAAVLQAAVKAVAGRAAAGG